MTLFQRLKSDPLLHDTQSFVHLLLHRLSISEVIAASKFKKSITDEVGQEPNALKKGRNRQRTLFSLGRHGPFNTCDRIPMWV